MNTCLITGGTGTFGSSYLITAIKNQWHQKIIIFSRDEYKQSKLLSFLTSYFEDLTSKPNVFSLRINDCDIRFFIGDVRDYNRLLLAFRDVDLVIHTAALKHVPVCEYNVEEALNTNINGTLNVIKAADKVGVKHVISLSTDKAVDPINLYGASKMCLEKITLNHRLMTASSTVYSVVRYGNVIGSRGSLLERLLKDNEKLSITNPAMTRFWFSIEKAIDLVRRAVLVNLTGSLLVPPMKALSLQKTFEYLRPDLNPPVSGFRPGEKKHELILSAHELGRAYSNDDFTIVFAPAEYGGGGNNARISPLQQQHDIIIEKFNLTKTDGTSCASNTAPVFEREEFIHAVQNTIINDL